MNNEQVKKPRGWKIPLVTLVVNDDADHGENKIHVIEAEPVNQMLDKLELALEQISNIEGDGRGNYPVDIESVKAWCHRDLTELTKLMGQGD